jgi:hypothetical protein
MFKDINLVGKEIKQEFEDLSVKAQKFISIFNSRMNSSKFEIAYAFSVSKKQRLQTMKDVKEVRSKLWAEALKKANGNVNVAYDVYKKLCDFS